MASKKTGNKTGQEKDRTAHWQHTWVKRVLRGNYSPFEKLLFMRIKSFGRSGCWMQNETLMDEFSCKRRVITKALTNLWEGDELTITGWNGHGRRIYAKHDPEVRQAIKDWYFKALQTGKVASKEDFFRQKRIRGYTTVQEIGR